MSSYRYVLSIDNSHPERYKYSGRVIYHVGKNPQSKKMRER